MTDHRTEAEKWLDSAADIWNDTEDVADPASSALIPALIGIGHALLANLGSNRPYDYQVTMDEPAWDRCHWWTDGDGWAYTGQTHWPERRRCVLYANHEGDHSDPPHQPEEATQ